LVSNKRFIFLVDIEEKVERMKKITVVFFFLLCFVISHESLAGFYNGHIWRHFTTEDGLSQNTVMDILQDQKGYMWFSTWNGLSRFDGYNFRSYKVRPGDDVYLTNSRIDKIVEDRYGYLWLLTYGKNVVRFDTELEIFHNVPERIYGNIQVSDIKTLSSGVTWLLTETNGAIRIETDTSSNSLNYRYYSIKTELLHSNLVYQVLLDSNLNEWILTDNGLAVVENGKTEAHSFFSNSKLGTYHQSFFTGFENEDEIWFGSADGKVWRYIKEGRRFIPLQVPVDSDICAIHQVSSANFMIITKGDGFLIYNIDRDEFEHFKFGADAKNNLEYLPKSYQSKNGDIWIQITKKLLVQYQSKTNRVKKHSVGAINIVSSSEPEFMIQEDIQGILWIHPFGGGVYFYDGEKDELSEFFTEEEAKIKFVDQLHSMYSDRQGNLWMGTRAKGLERFIFPNKRFKVQVVDHTPHFIKDNDVRALFEDSKGFLWVSTKADKLAVFNVEEKLLGYLGKDGRLHADASFLSSSVYSIMEDSEGNIWIATKGEGLIKAIPEHSAGGWQMRLQFFKHDASDIYSLSHDDVYSVHEDSKGHIWVATYGGGINLLQKDKARKIRFLNYRNHLTRYPIGDCHRVRYITSSSSGRVFVGTTHGLVVFNSEFDQPEDIQFFNYSYKPSDPFCLSNNDVHGILETKNGDMFIATFGGGLNKLTSSQESLEYRFKSYTSEDGLQNDALLSVLEDDSGFVWIVSENGISKFNSTLKSFINFSKTDFSRTLSFSEGSGLIKRNGELFFGTNQGVLSFHPDSISTKYYIPSIVFTEFRLLNKLQRPSADGVLTKHINSTHKIILKHNQNLFSIGFAALDMKNPEAISYAARLEGFDNDWVFLDHQRMLNFTNLPVGSYKLRVRSTNSDGLWMTNEKVINIDILPSFWATPLAFVLYFILFTLIAGVSIYILFVIYRLRHQIVVDNQITEMKLEFFTDISHELRTPLTLIRSPLEQVLNDSLISTSSREALEVVERNSVRMLRLINQLLDFVKIKHQKLKMTVEKVHIPSFASSVMSNFRLNALEQKIDFTLSDNTETGYVWADIDKLEKVIFNLLSNAFKFIGDGKFIKISVDELPDTVIVKVMDDGIGISETKKGVLFQRFENSVKDGINKKLSSGIGLSVVQEMVNLHNGEISVECNGERGTIFILKLKKGLEHFGEEVEILEEDGISVDDALEPILTHEDIEDLDLEEHSQKPVLLLVEDNFEVRRFIKSVLIKEYIVVEAPNGEIGYELAKKHLPDVIVSDLMMPVKDGLELLKYIREDIETSHIPFIMLTAKTDKKSHLEGITQGADDYITKPFSPSYLQARIINLLKLRSDLQIYFQGKHQTVPGVDVEPSLPQITSNDEKFLAELKELMERNIDNNSLVVEELVAEMALSRSVFFKKLKALTGLSPIEYIREMRLKRSKQLIEAGQYNMTQITYMVGLNDPRYFSKSFKQRFGCTPSEYKKRYEEQN